MKKAGTDGMKLRVLVDNNTYIDRYYLGEPAVSYYIECDGIRLLFDAGYSMYSLKMQRLLESTLAWLHTWCSPMAIMITQGDLNS